MIIFSLLSSLSIKWFFDLFSKIKDEAKIKDRAILAVRQLDILHMTVLKDKNYNTIEMKNIEFGIVSAIESWNDILPELKYRDRKYIMQEIERQLNELKNNEKLSKEEYDLKVEALKPEIKQIEYLGLNYSGDTKPFQILKYEDFIKGSMKK